jgi:hypothetical protein
MNKIYNKWYFWVGIVTIIVGLIAGIITFTKFSKSDVTPSSPSSIERDENVTSASDVK